MKKKNKSIIITFVLILLAIGIIALIYLINSDENHSEETIKCIAEDSKVFVSKTCSACAYQKKILENYLDYFEIIYIDEHPELFEQYDVKEVPTWLINDKKYVGVQSISELKEITNCD